MFKRYFRDMIRSLYKGKVYAAVNVVSLSVGIASCIVLGLYIKSELTYDRHFDQYERIFRVSGERISEDGNILYSANVSPLLGPYLQRSYREIESFVRFDSTGGGFIGTDEISYYWDRDVSFHTDPNIFEIFDHEIISGDPETALVDPFSVAISEKFARMYFGEEDPIGKIVTRREIDYSISLVFADSPANTHFKYDLLFPHSPSTTSRQVGASGGALTELWVGGENPAYTYLLMPESYNSASFQRISEEVSDDLLEQILQGSGFSQRFYLERLDETHFSSITERDFPRGNKFYPLALGVIALFVLLVGCLNYMILATARATRRAKEVAMRKIIGAKSSNLALQFIGESLFFSLLALVAGIALAELALNVLFSNNILGIPIGLSDLLDFQTSGIIIISTLLVGIVSGLYPAAYLSNMPPLTPFTGSPKSGIKGSIVRRGLVFIQFLVSISFVSCAIFMFMQMKFVEDKQLGFNKENKITMVVHGANNTERLPVFISELEQNANILGATISMNIPGEVSFFNQSRVETNEGNVVARGFNRAFIDEQYLETLGMELLLGANLNSDLRPDDRYALVNEALVESMGWENPLGKRIDRLQVLGVVKDFHFQNLHQPVAPLFMQYHLNYLDYGGTAAQRMGQNRTLTIRTTGIDTAETLEFISQKWSNFNTGYAFEYRYLDDALDQLYGSDYQQVELISLFAGLCILISCLGLYSLSALSIEQRTREIGIRKVVGASTAQIIFLLFESISYLVIAAAVAASYLSYLMTTEWLNGFYYRIDLNLSVFMFSAVIVVVVAYLTIAIQSFRAARENPALTLRYE